MPNLWNATIAGHLGRDAESKTVNDQTVVEWSMAVSSKSKDKEHTTWIRCTYWGNRAGKVAQYLKKGKAVLAIGGMSERGYEKDGQAKTSLELRVDSLTLLGGAEKSEPQADRPAPSRPAQAAGGSGDDEPPFARHEDRSW